MFEDKSLYPRIKAMEDNANVIIEEFDKFYEYGKDCWIPYFSDGVVSGGGWDLFGFRYEGMTYPALLDFFRKKFPKTLEIIGEELPSLAFSRIQPGVRMNLHTGDTPTFLRCSLGIHVPDGCFLECDGEVVQQRDRVANLFDDTKIHRAYNESKKERIVLLTDHVKHGCVFAGSTIPARKYKAQCLIIERSFKRNANLQAKLNLEAN